MFCFLSEPCWLWRSSDGSLCSHLPVIYSHMHQSLICRPAPPIRVDKCQCPTSCPEQGPACGTHTVCWWCVCVLTRCVCVCSCCALSPGRTPRLFTSCCSGSSLLTMTTVSGPILAPSMSRSQTRRFHQYQADSSRDGRENTNKLNFITGRSATGISSPQRSRGTNCTVY